MKSLNLKPVLEWFGYSRRERRASFILIILIISVAAVRFVLPERSMNIEVIPVDINDSRIETFKGKSIPELPEIESKRAAKPIKPLINLNTCDSAQLESLPGIGPVLAVRIIKFRNLLGGFAFIEQLREVYGLPEETYLLISGMVYADSSDIKKINVNMVLYKQLIRFPYFEKTEVDAILNFRKKNGRISGMADIEDNQLIASDKIKKIQPYLEF